MKRYRKAIVAGIGTGLMVVTALATAGAFREASTIVLAVVTPIGVWWARNEGTLEGD